MKDQAEQLRARILKQHETKKARLIAVTSGKGGVGKSNFALNFALSLIEQGQRTLLIDLDLGFGNIDVLLGYSPRYSVVDLLKQPLSLTQVVEEGPHGLLLISGGSGLDQLVDVPPDKLNQIITELEMLEKEVDQIILDTGAGLDPGTLPLLLTSDDVFLVTTPEPTSLTDAYAVLKMLANHHPALDVRVIVNRCRQAMDGLKTAQRLQSVAKQFLDKEIGYLGHVVQDPAVPEAVIKQVPLVHLFPHSSAAQGVRLMAAQYLNRPLTKQREERSGLGCLLRRLVEPWRKPTG